MCARRRRHACNAKGRAIHVGHGRRSDWILQLRTATVWGNGDVWLQLLDQSSRDSAQLHKRQLDKRLAVGLGAIG